MTGARLPSGRRNVKARFRVGSGGRGPLKQGQAPKPMGRLKPLSAVFMPAPAVNGADPETADGARETAPNRMQGLGRLVALPDYEAEALALPGVRKARAAWVAPQGSPRLQLIVLTDGGTEAEAAAVAAAMTLCQPLPRRQPVPDRDRAGHSSVPARGPDRRLRAGAAAGGSRAADPARARRPGRSRGAGGRPVRLQGTPVRPGRARLPGDRRRAAGRGRDLGPGGRLPGRSTSATRPRPTRPSCRCRRWRCARPPSAVAVTALLALHAQHLSLNLAKVATAEECPA